MFLAVVLQQNLKLLARLSTVAKQIIEMSVGCLKLHQSVKKIQSLW
jgi:hypothetical protein